MNLKEVNKQLNSWFDTRNSHDGIIIYPEIFFDGEEIGFLFSQKEDKYAHIQTTANFGERVAFCTDGWRKVTPVIQDLIRPYGVNWDENRGVLFIQFRRNEITITQAVMRLTQAVFVVGSLGETISLP